MATSSLLAAVSAGLSGAASLGYTSSSAAHDVYEAYILTLFIRAADQEHWHWELHDQSCSLTSHAVFRMGPGRLPSGNFTHVHLTKRGKVSLEAHIGVKVAGISPVRHEFDLLVLRAAEAGRCRTFNTDPHHSAAVVHTESKFYGGNLPLPLGRAVVGLTIDCGLAGKSILATNRNGFTVEQLVTYYGTTFRFLITPSNPTGEYHIVQRFRGMLASAP